MTNSEWPFITILFSHPQTFQFEFKVELFSHLQYQQSASPSKTLSKLQRTSD